MAGRLTPLNCREIEQKLKTLGFVKDHIDGSIRFWVREKGGKKYVVQVHFHPGERGLDIIKTILRQGGISRNEWLMA